MPLRALRSAKSTTHYARQLPGALAFYTTALLRASRELDTSEIEAEIWARALSAAIESISEIGGAKVGGHTVLDALAPAVEAMTNAVANGASLHEAWGKAVHAAQKGADATAPMRPRLGRATYLRAHALGSHDAGAVAVLVWKRAPKELD